MYLQKIISTIEKKNNGKSFYVNGGKIRKEYQNKYKGLTRFASLANV